MKTGLKKFVEIAAVSGILGCGVASVGTSAATNSNVAVVMDALVDSLHLYEKLLVTPFCQWDKYKEDAQRIAKILKDNEFRDESFWYKHFMEREEWKKENDNLVSFNQRLELLDKESRERLETWVMSNVYPWW